MKSYLPSIKSILRVGAFSICSCFLLACGDAAKNASATKPRLSPVSFDVVSSTVQENVVGGNVTIYVSRTTEDTGAATVNYTTHNGTAVNNADFVVSPGVITFAEGETRKGITVAITDDEVFEFSEDFTLRLSTPGGNLALGRVIEHTVNITDNDGNYGTIAFEAASVSEYESVLGGFININVVRTGGSDGSVSVKYSTMDNSATAGSDYIAVDAGLLEFSHGETSKMISIEFVNDDGYELDETFSIVLSDPEGGVTLGNLISHVVTVQDDDSRPGTIEFQLASSTVNETVEGGNALIKVIRSGGSDGSVSVMYATENDTALAGSDYTGISNGTLVFDDGVVSQEIAIAILRDTVVEATETFTVNLSNPTGGVQLGGNLTHTVSITDAVGVKFNKTVFSIAPATDGSGDIYVGGSFTSYDGIAVDRVARINGDGTLDVNFVAPGIFNDSVYTLAAATDNSGDIYVGGRSQTGNGSPALVRLNSDGSVDETFNTSEQGGFGGLNNFVVDIMLATDGSDDIYVGGQFTSYKGVEMSKFVRLDKFGNIPAGFGVGTGFNDFARALAPVMDDSGDVYIGGNFTRYKNRDVNYILRIDRDGNRNNSFNTGTGFNGFVFSNGVALDGSGDVYYGGRFTTYNDVDVKNIARINSNGTHDSGFATGNGANIGFNSDVYFIEPDTNGTVYVGGSFSTYKGQPAPAFVRLTSGGNIDNAFDVGSGFNGPVEAIALANDGSGDVFVGGNFTTYKGTTVNRFVRLNSVGNIVN